MFGFHLLEQIASVRVQAACVSSSDLAFLRRAEVTLENE